MVTLFVTNTLELITLLEAVTLVDTILAALIFIVFGNTLFNGYNMDDHLVTQNHKYTSKGISSIKDILSTNYYSNNT